MNTITDLNPGCCGRSFAATDGYSGNAAGVRQTAVSAGQRTDITIVTDDKDKVTLSFDADYQSFHTTYSALVANHSGYAIIEGERFAFDLSLEQSIRMEGDLNEQESKDISKVLKRLNRIMKKFLAGRMDDLAPKAGRLFNNMQTIDSVEARLIQSDFFQKLQHLSVKAPKAPEDNQYPQKPVILTPNGGQCLPCIGTPITIVK